MGAGLVKIANKVEGAGEEALFRGWYPGRLFTSAAWN
jgi:hypothetical protein